MDAAALVAGQPVLNLPMIAELRAALGAEAVAGMMPTFIRNMVEYRDQLAQALAEGDLVKSRRAAHALKGLAAQFGALQVSVLARAIEQDASDIGEVKDLLDAIRGALTTAARAIATELPSPEVASAAAAAAE